MPITERECFNRILGVFPDIAHDYVLHLYRDRVQHGTRGPELCDALVTHILDSGQYPRERDRRLKLKRKRQEYVDGIEKRDDQLVAGEQKDW